MWNFISDEEYNSIASDYRKMDFERVTNVTAPNNDLVSWLVSYATDSSLLWFMVWWSLWGALIWDMLNDWNIID